MEYASRLMYDTTKTLPPLLDAADEKSGQKLRHSVPASFGGCDPHAHLRHWRRKPTSMYDFRSLYASGTVQTVPCPETAYSLEEKLHRSSVWKELNPIQTAVKNTLPSLRDIFLEQKAYRSAYGRRAYDRTMENGNDVMLFGSPLGSDERPRSGTSSSIWEAGALPADNEVDEDIESEDSFDADRDLLPVINLPKGTMLHRDNDVMSMPPPLSHIPSVAAARSKAASLPVPGPGPMHRGFKIRPLLIKNERHMKICFPDGKKWKPNWKPVSYKNFVLPSVSPSSYRNADTREL